jgi:hypothetical protein
MPYKPKERQFLERKAAELRGKPGVLDGSVLRVEALADVLGLELLPKAGLKDEFGIEAYLAGRKNTIVVDRDVMDFGSPRYLFTFAEEIAHHVIHVDDRPKVTLQTCVLSLSQHDYELLEWDAKYLAGAMLMPVEEFESIFRRSVQKEKEALGNAGDRETITRYAIRKCYQAFGVSFHAAVIRAQALDLIDSRMKANLEKYLRH